MENFIFYGTEESTFIRTNKGLFLIQSDDVETDFLPKKIEKLPAEAKKITAALCSDLEIAAEVWADYRIYVDYENNADDWWQNANENHPTEADELFEPNTHELFVTKADFDKIWEWATSTKGWDDSQAPDFAKHPLCYEEL